MEMTRQREQRSIKRSFQRVEKGSVRRRLERKDEGASGED